MVTGVLHRYLGALLHLFEGDVDLKRVVSTGYQPLSSIHTSTGTTQGRLAESSADELLQN